ncbi:MFS transporter [Sciscionella sediminilitoris]|uniref:MFS transporter n=1 Tax=Sciscionella sediminilitoris TaxID=1445613 RepID=UPI0004DF147E|nr:MFS transporter [Sciscionella sp. SE31]
MSTPVTTAPAKRSLARRALWATWSGWGLDGFNKQILPLAMAGILVALGLTKADAGVVTGTVAVVTAVGGIIGGRVADKFGRVRVLVAIMIGYSIATALVATAQDLPQLMLWVSLAGLFLGAEWPVGAALMAEYADQQRRGRTLAWVQSAWSVGWALANLSFLITNLVFAPATAWRVMFLVGLLPAIVALIVRRALREAPNTTATAGAQPRERGVYRELFGAGLRRRTIVGALFGAAGLGSTQAIQTWIPLYLAQERGLSISGAAIYLWFMIAGNWLGYVLGGQLHDAIGRRWAFTAFYLGTAVFGLLFLGVAVDALWFNLLLAALVGFFMAAQASGKGALFTELFPARVRASGAGICYEFGALFTGLISAVIGWTSGQLGLGNAIAMALGLCTVLTVVLIWLLPETRDWELD